MHIFFQPRSACPPASKSMVSARFGIPPARASVPTDLVHPLEETIPFQFSHKDIKLEAWKTLGKSWVDRWRLGETYALMCRIFTTKNGKNKSTVLILDLFCFAGYESLIFDQGMNPPCRKSQLRKLVAGLRPRGSWFSPIGGMIIPLWLGWCKIT